MDHLKNDENKLRTMLVCGLLDISVIPITNNLLEKMRILTHAQDLEYITLRQEDSAAGRIWKTFHSEWDAELLSFLYKDKREGTELKRRTRHLEDIKSIFVIGNEKITASVITSLYCVALDKRVPIDTVEKVTSKQMPNSYLSEKSRRGLYALVIAVAYTKLERYDKAIEKCEEALNIDKSVPALNNKVCLFLI